MTSAMPPRLDTVMWPTAYPRHRGQWTLRGDDGRWGALDPNTGKALTVEPADDADLPALRVTLGAGTLLGYRVGRRAVVATPTGYVKVVRPKRLRSLVSIHEWFEDSFRAGDTPVVQRADTRGAVELSPVAGVALHQLLRGRVPERRLFAAIDHLSAMVAGLHATPFASHLPERIPDEPARWLDTIRHVDLEAARTFAPTASRLPALADTDLVVTHGDLHDKNLLVGQGSVGLIDLDSVAVGAAEDDVANLAVHLQLRVLQSGQSPGIGERLANRFYQSYRCHRSLHAERLHAAEAHTWFRLACIYHFRSSSKGLVPELLRRAVERPGDGRSVGRSAVTN